MPAASTVMLEDCHLNTTETSDPVNDVISAVVRLRTSRLVVVPAAVLYPTFDLSWYSEMPHMKPSLASAPKPSQDLALLCDA
eukprot:206760-Prymnesium_polylepis.1